MKMDTIYALATARGKAGISVVRISGPDAKEAVIGLAGSVPDARKAGLRMLRDIDGARLDECLVLGFDANKSFTGEETVELHLHGSTATASAVLGRLSAIPGLRPAEPGEFTRRALENERLDIAQVEGLADLIDAETEAQRRQALRLLSGDLGSKANRWRTDLIRAAALLEATIDFADEEVPEDVSPEVLILLATVRKDIEAEILGVKVSERIRDGFEVAIVGPPNIGKSTLLNKLAGREAAITSEYAGTTRDVIEVRMDLRGLPVTILDTAGIRATDDHLEGIGIARARERADAADLRVFLTDGAYGADGLEPRPGDIVAIGKGDTHTGTERAVSGLTGEGVAELIDDITRVLEQRTAGAATATRERHRIALGDSLKALESAQSEVLQGVERAEIAAEELRTAIGALDSLIGKVDVENILDEIFASFCLGK